jgi:hypothetical protein
MEASQHTDTAPASGSGLMIPTYDPSEFNLHAQVACVRREIWMRKTKYPQWLAAGRTKMTPDEMGKGIACMEAVLVTISKLLAEDQKRNNPTLFDRLTPQ